MSVLYLPDWQAEEIWEASWYTLFNHDLSNLQADFRSAASSGSLQQNSNP